MSKGLGLTRRGLLAAGGAFVLFFDPLSQSGAQTPQLPGSLATNRRLGLAAHQRRRHRHVDDRQGRARPGACSPPSARSAPEQLDVALARVRIVSGDTGLTPNEGTTAGSQSMQYGGTAVQFAAAEMRAILLGMAAQRLGVDIGTLSVADGTVSTASGSSTTYWALLGGRTIEREASASVRPKRIRRPIASWARPRRASTFRPRCRAGPPTCRTSASGHGACARGASAAYGARLASVDAAAVAERPGMIMVMRDGSFLAAIATREEMASPPPRLCANRRAGRAARRPGGTASDDWLLAQRPKDIAVKAQDHPTAARSRAPSSRRIDGHSRCTALGRRRRSPCCATAP
jgi:hypothetical protein